jgi:hypothetical protein
MAEMILFHRYLQSLQLSFGLRRLAVVAAVVLDALEHLNQPFHLTLLLTYLKLQSFLQF